MEENFDQTDSVDRDSLSREGNLRFGKLFRRALVITWKHRVLWVFGFLVALDINLRFLWYYLPSPEQENLRSCLQSLIWLLFTIVNFLGTAAQIDQINRVEEGSPTSLSAGWTAGKRFVWRLCLILAIPLVALSVALVPAFIGIEFLKPVAQEYLPLLDCIVPIGVVFLICLFLLVILVIALASCACVLKDCSASESLEEGWRLFRAHKGQAIELLIITTGIGLAVNFLFRSGWRIIQGMSSQAGLTVKGGVSILGWLLGMMIFVIMATFDNACWTLAYREWTKSAEILEAVQE